MTITTINEGQLIKSKNGKVNILVVDSLSKIYTTPILYKTDFSFVEVPESPEVAKVFYQSLYSSQSATHLVANTVRSSKANRLTSMLNLAHAEQAGFSFQDVISVVSDKEQKKTPGTLTSFCDFVYLFTKQESMNIDATVWFNPELRQASNVWMVEASEKEKPSVSTCKVFCGQFGDIISSLASPLIHRSFSVFGVVSFNHMVYARLRNYGVYAVTDDMASARKVVTMYNSPKIK